MNEQRDIWAARKKAAEEAQKTAETRELKTLALAYKNARGVASYFYNSTDIAGKLNLRVLMADNDGCQSDVVNRLLRRVIPKNAELADYIWKECMRAVKEAKEETTELLVQNLRTIGTDMPSDLG